MTAPYTLLDYVRAHAAREWFIFPCNGKTPIVKWRMASTITPKMLQMWWEQQDYNIGVDCGKSGLVVIDEDVLGAFEKLCAANNQPVPDTYTVTTHNGRHFYFRAPDGDPIRNTAKKVYPGVDVRGEGGYVIGAGSTHTEGTLYSIAQRGAAVPMPEWLATALWKLAASEPAPAESGLPPDPMANEAPGFALGDVIKDGDRDDTLFRYASQLRARNLSPYEQEMLMRDAFSRCEQPPIATEPFTWEQAKAKLSQSQKYTAGKSPEFLAKQVGNATGREPLDVSNSGVMADWLRENMGTGPLSEIYLRGDTEIVHVPHRGGEGYKALTNSDADDDGPAQVRALRADGIASKVSYIYEPFRWVKNDQKELVQKKSLFPPDAARTAFASPEMMRGLRSLRGVVHSPTIRRDGSLLDTAGYDSSTELLYQPTPGLEIPPIPEVPTGADVTQAREMLLYMIADFSFETEVDRANYLGMLLTPLMRSIAPPPYKMALIEAHQPASGKTFLARALTLIHGGVIRSEMPHDETEVTKVVTAILDTTTAPVVVFDNTTGLIQSSVLSGLLTQPRWNERRLGTGGMVDAQNDRLWVLTGNNLAISGDLDRRTMRVKIDPGMPHPELRTGFAIPDFEGWVITQRGNLLWSLLVLIRSWFASGQPLGGERGADNYRKWASSVEGILGNGGFGPARFTDPAIVSTSGAGAEDDEWRVFLEAVYSVKGSGPWTTRDILALVDDVSIGHVEGVSPLRPIPYDALPGDLLAKRRQYEPLSRLGRALGWWLSHREGRWAGQFSARRGSETNFGVQWSVSRYGEQ